MKESSIYQLPVYRLSTSKTRAWRYNPAAREKMVEWLTQKYRKGVIVCMDTMRVIAFISPQGNVAPAKPPFRQLPIDLIDNAPHVENCLCQAWVHPDSGIWAKNQSSKDEHHPYCQFHEHAVPNWVKEQGGFVGWEQQITLDGRKPPEEVKILLATH